MGNLIGTDITGRLPLGNEIHGVLINQGASNNSIGGTATGAGNTIAFNLDNGVDVVGLATTGNSIVSNLIFNNGLLGIDLGDDGVTLNHATATAGPNRFQNFPVITSVVSSGTSPIIGGTLNSVANTSFLVQFYANAVAPALGYGQGEQSARLSDRHHRLQWQRGVQCDRRRVFSNSAAWSAQRRPT